MKFPVRRVAAEWPLILASGFSSWPVCFPQLLPVTTMTTKSPQPKGRDRALSTLNGLIQVLNLAKDACGIPPAQVAFCSAVVLLTMIRASSPLFCGYLLPTYVHPGLHGQQTGLRRPRAVLR